MNVTHSSVNLPAQPHAKRFGTVAAKIGTNHQRKLQFGMRLPSGRVVAPGAKVYFRVEDITRHPEAAAHVKWVCCNVECVGKEFASKGALLADHADNRELAKREETHLYYAVADIPALEAQPEKIEKGRIVAVAVEAKPATLMLLSDEE